MDPASDERERWLEAIMSSAHQAAKLSRQMLIYSGRSAPIRGDVDVVDAIAGIKPFLVGRVLQHDRLEFELERVLVNGDETHLAQIVLSLVTNAAEACEESGGTVRVIVTRRDDRAVITVADDGCGLDAETQRRMFDPFFSTKFPGRGLGLASVQGTVRGHAGKISTVGSPGVGTVVTVELPATDPSLTAAVASCGQETVDGRQLGRRLRTPA